MDNILWNPGPVNTHNDIKNEYIKYVDSCHREKFHLELKNEVASKIFKLYDINPLDWEIKFLFGSGTLAIDSIISSLPLNTKLYVYNHGVYGQRAINYAKMHNIDLSNDPNDADFYYLVHHETTDGMLNLIDEWSKFLNKPIIIDAISSFGVEDINFNDKNLYAVISNSNKCLQSLPGIAFVIYRKNINFYTRNLYSSIPVYKNSLVPYTESTGLFAALNKSLDLNSKNSLRQNCEEISIYVDKEMEKLGFIKKTYNDQFTKNSLVLSQYDYNFPFKLDLENLHDFLKEKNHIIYISLNSLRLSFIGKKSLDDAQDLIEHIRAYLMSIE